jgi:dienelactone hydrolase
MIYTSGILKCWAETTPSLRLTAGNCPPYREQIAVIRIHASLLLFSIFAFPPLVRAQDLAHVFPDADRIPSDSRLAPPRRVSEGNNFRAFTDRAAWEIHVRQLREQALVANGLWPLPEKCPLNPVVTGVVDCGDYTIENIYFQSYPGFYVTGSLFRPKGAGPFPAVLNAHGHAKLGRLEKSNPTLRDGKPSTDPFPYQARGVGFARLGCIAFLYDMVGYAESKQLRHPTDSPKMRVPEGTDDFEGLEFEMHCLSTQGLQTWNSMRVVDYLLSRPDVDPKRIAITGASGGATQTLMLMMTDDRVAAAAPVCMVCTGFQGDCTCEQCALGKIGTDTIEYCASFAPKPLIVVGATSDWTKEIIEKGGPQIRSTYDLAGAGEKLDIVRYPAPHNYNRRSREAVYDWLNRNWNLGKTAPISEQPFKPVTADRLTVFSDAHPRPADALDAAGLKRLLIESGRRQMEAIRPTDRAKLEEFRRIVQPALRQMVASELPGPQGVEAKWQGPVERNGVHALRVLLSRTGSGEQVPAILFQPRAPAGNAVVLVHPRGKAGLLNAAGDPAPLLAGLLAKGRIVLAIDTFMTGEFHRQQNQTPAPDPHTGFFPCFNRTLLAQRVHDILTAIASVHSGPGMTPVHVDLVGLEEAGPWCLLARGLCNDVVGRTAVDLGGFSFTEIKDVADPMYLPGALRYGEISALAALAAPGELLLADTRTLDMGWVRDAYRSVGIHGDAELRIESKPITTEALLAWLAR